MSVLSLNGSEKQNGYRIVVHYDVVRRQHDSAVSEVCEIIKDDDEPRAWLGPVQDVGQMGFSPVGILMCADNA